MLKSKKTIEIIAIIAAVTAVAAVICFAVSSHSSKKQIKELEKRFDGSIIEIRLRQTVDSIDYVAFDDAELIEKWQKTLSEMRLLDSRNLTRKEKHMIGGKPTIVLKYQNEELTFCISDGYLNYDGNLYTVDKDLPAVFDETYKIAVEKYGLTRMYQNLSGRAHSLPVFFIIFNRNFKKTMLIFYQM